MRPSNNRATSSLPLHSPIPSTYGTCRVCARNEASNQGANLRFFFDSVYIRAAAGSVAYFPELSLPESFDASSAREWCERIRSPRLRTLVNRRLRDVLKGADREA